MGGVLYVLIELAWRGWSHWTMFILGGICFIYLGLINEILSWNTPLWQQILIGTAGITALEFLTGCIVNLWLGWGIWDYSGMPGNILGQITRTGSVQVDANVPLAEMFGYATDLRSKTQGRGNYSMEPSHYTELPKSKAEEIIKARMK